MTDSGTPTPTPKPTRTDARTLPEPLYGVYGGAPAEYAAAARDHGANAAFFHGFDAAAFEACAAHGLAACVEQKTFRAGFDQHPELVPTGADGNPVRYGSKVQGVCLSQSAFTDQIEADLRAGLATYQPAGVWLDYLTYTGWFETPDPDLQESCFCADCIAAFCAATGVDADQPAQILSAHAAAWGEHKRNRIAAFTARYAAVVRELAPGAVVGAYMCPWYRDEYDGALGRIFGQDYALMAPAIDVFTPLIYAAKCGRPPQWAREFLDRADELVPAGRQVQLILDTLDFPDSMQAAAAAKRPSWGIQLFGGAQLFTGDGEGAAAFGAGLDALRAGWQARGHG